MRPFNPDVTLHLVTPGDVVGFPGCVFDLKRVVLLVGGAVSVPRILVVMDQIGLPDRRAIATTLLLAMNPRPVHKPLVECTRIVVVDDVGVARVFEQPPGSAHMMILPVASRVQPRIAEQEARIWRRQRRSVVQGKRAYKRILSENTIASASSMRNYGSCSGNSA